MIIFVNKNKISNKHADFLEDYHKLHPTHKLYVEYDLFNFIDFKEKQLGKKIDPLIKKRVARLRFDIYDSTKDVVYEVDGQQHYKYTPHFHKSLADLDEQVIGDKLKEYVCEFFNVKLHRII
jgi:hypothetical protein